MTGTPLNRAHGPMCGRPRKGTGLPCRAPRVVGLDACHHHADPADVDRARAKRNQPVNIAAVFGLHRPPPPVFGPYETEVEAAAGPIARDARDAALTPDGMAPVVERHLIAACEAAGVTLGDHDRAVLAWLAGWEPTTAQTIAGLISRANRGGPR